MTNASKGHAMNRGTLMVLKRLIVTTLGALGLGALAAGTALAQGTGPGSGNIPAPDLFNDQIACSMNVPTKNPTPTQLPKDAEADAKTMLETAIGMGDMAIDAATATALGFVINPMYANCGGGDPTADGDDLDTDPDFPEFTAMENGAEATDVAVGYKALLGEYMKVYGAPGDATSTGSAGDVAAKRKALETALEGRTATFDNAVAIKSAQDALDAAQKTHAENVAAYNAISQGPIYQAGVAEWMAKAAVTDSIAKYDAAVGKVADEKEIVDRLDYADYVPLREDDLLDGLTAADGTPDIGNLRTYANLHDEANTVAVQDEETGAITGTGNFDAAGNLLIPLSDADSDDETPLTPTKDGMTVMQIRDRVESANKILADLKKAQADNLIGGLDEVYDEAVRRVQAEVDHYNAQWADTLADDTRQDGGAGFTDDVDTPDVDESMTTIAAQQAAYTKESNARVVAELDLRAKAAAREGATAHVVAQFTSPGSFYQQLIDRREALQNAADQKVAKASEDGATPSKSLTEAATKAAEAVTDAEESQADYLAFVGELDGPTATLIDELLKGDGDDGGALVQAIAGTYDTAKEALDAVAGLGGEDGAVSTNTANIATNATNIGENADDIVALDGRVTANEDDIEALDGRVTVNEGAIMTNAGNIATNSTNIMANRTDIDANIANIATNTAGIATNAGDIMTNAGHIMENRGMIEMNTAGVSSNADAIAANMNSIGSNSASISDNRNMIGELSDDLDVVRAGVAASMALAGMPAINGRGISIGVGSFDGESAFAVGFQIQGEMASFKVGLTSGGGATGASAGVGFQF